MCGIAGFSGDFSQAELRQMGEKIAHRGPDGKGEFHSVQGSVGLAHRRLSIIELTEAGHQPMVDPSGKVIISYNGEIYNYKELRQSLIQQGHSFQGGSDTEVLLHMYLQYGPEMLKKLNGIFAFAIWDERSQSLFITRDNLGVKPLYYSQTPRGLVFSSELKSLLCIKDLPRTLDAEAVMQHLTYLWCPAPRTILSAVKKLLPGHAMLVKAGRLEKMWKYDELPYDQPIAKMNETEAVQQLDSALREAVRRQMVADVPVGAFLSGGLDSSSVVAFAKETQPDSRMQCFTIGFKDGKGEAGFAEDLPYAQKVAKHLDVDLHTIVVGSEMTNELEKMIYHLDEPLADPAPLNALFICRMAREHGIKVLLSGAGGDDIFTGYRRHFALMQERYWDWAPEWARSGLASGVQLLPTVKPMLRRVRKAFEYADLPEDERLASYFFWGQPSKLRELLSPEIRQQQNEPVSKVLLDSLKAVPADTPPLNRMLFLETKFFLADHNLNYTDKMSMATGVEVRVPLLDPDLVSLAARMPLEFKQHGHEGKWIFKKTMEKYLPHDVIYRPKTGFGAPLRTWLHHELKPLLMDTLSAESLTRRGLFDPPAVASLIQKDASGQIDATYSLFSLICIELWCRIFLDRDQNVEG